MPQVKYFIPEDGDDADHPNVFSINASDLNNITLHQFKAVFPVPGQYHFRFLKTASTESLRVWYDLVNDNQLVPVCDGQIIAKVTRIVVCKTQRPSPAVTIAPQTTQPVKTDSKPQAASIPVVNVNHKTASLIDDDDDDLDFPTKHDHENNNNSTSNNTGHPSGGNGNAKPPNFDVDLLDVSSAPISKTSSSSSVDLFGLDSLKPSVATIPLQQTNRSGNNMNNNNLSMQPPSLQQQQQQRGIGGGSQSPAFSGANLNNLNSMSGFSMGQPQQQQSQQQQQQQQQQQGMRGNTPINSARVVGGYDAFSGLGDSLKPKK